MAVSPAHPGTLSWLPLFQGPLSTCSWWRIALGRDNLRDGWRCRLTLPPPTSLVSDCRGSPGQEQAGNKTVIMEGQWLMCDFFWGSGSPSSHSSPPVTRWRCRASSLLGGLLGASGGLAARPRTHCPSLGLALLLPPACLPSVPTAGILGPLPACSAGFVAQFPFWLALSRSKTRREKQE